MKELQGMGLAPGRTGARAMKIVAAPSLDNSFEQELSWQEVRGAVKEKLAQSYAKADSEVAKDLLTVQQLIADDPGLSDRIQSHLQSGKSLSTAIESAIEEVAQDFLRINDPYWQERIDDVRDVGRQLVAAARGTTSSATPSPILDEPVVVMAEKLFPSDVFSLPRENIRGFIVAEGTKTSHVAILARSWKIPAVVLGSGLDEIVQGDMLFVDGEKGIVVVDPDPSWLLSTDSQRVKWPIIQNIVSTVDHIPVRIEANIGSLDDAKNAYDHGADGVGLLRTEFLFERDRAPEEEEQFEVLMQMASILQGKELVVRLADIGGDKPAPFLNLPHENNPFLGVRAIRLLQSYPHFYDDQIRAVLRAGQHYPLHLMFPMVASLEDWVLCLTLVERIRKETRLPSVPVGCMIEVPAAVYLADTLAQTADFFSIGTNDLIQYLFAADRTSPTLANYYQPLNPAVLEAIKQTMAAGTSHHIPVSLCGEMGGDPANLEILLGLGLRTFSVDPSRIEELKNRIQGLDTRNCLLTAESAMK